MKIKICVILKTQNIQKFLRKDSQRKTQRNAKLFFLIPLIFSICVPKIICASAVIFNTKILKKQLVHS